MLIISGGTPVGRTSLGPRQVEETSPRLILKATLLSSTHLPAAVWLVHLLHAWSNMFSARFHIGACGHAFSSDDSLQPPPCSRDAIIGASHSSRLLTVQRPAKGWNSFALHHGQNVSEKTIRHLSVYKVWRILELRKACTHPLYKQNSFQYRK